MITQIVVVRAEGPNELCGSWTFKGPTAEDEANKKLRQISLTAPKGGGYDKCDVTVTLSSGEEFTTRHDVKLNDIDGTVYDHAERWLSYLVTSDKKIITPETKKEATALLAVLRATR